MAVSVERLTGDHLLALGQDRRLLRNLGKRAYHTLVAVDKAIQGVRDAHFVTKVLDELLCTAEVVSGHPGVQVMDNLELQADVEEI